MGEQEAAETLGEFGPLFYHLGIRIAYQYKGPNDNLEYLVNTLYKILKTCREDDRHAILVIIAVTLLDVYRDDTVSEQVFRTIVNEGDGRVGTLFSDLGSEGRYHVPSITDEIRVLNEAFAKLEDFRRRTPFLLSSNRSNFLDKADGFTAGKELSCRSSICNQRTEYCLNVCAFIACAGYKNLPMLFGKHSSYVKNLFLRSIPKTGSYLMVTAVNRLWNQFKLYDCHGTQGDRFILPFLLSTNLDVAAALACKEELTSHQLTQLAETAEELLPVLEVATKAAENSFSDGLHTKLPEYWMIEYVLQDGVVEYKAREHDYELLGWVYQQCGANLTTTFTEEPIMSDEDLAL